MKEQIDNLLKFALSGQKQLIDLAVVLSWNYNESVRRAIEIIQQMQTIQIQIAALPRSQILRDSTTGRMYGKSIIPTEEFELKRKYQLLEQELQKLKDEDFKSKQLLLLPKN